MKRTLLLILFFSFSLISYGQTIQVDADTVWTVFHKDNNPSPKGKGKMINSTGQSVSVHWVKEEMMLPAGWEASFCDKTRCWLSFVNEGDVVLSGGEQGASEVWMDTHGMPGDTGVVRMTFLAEGDTTDVSQAVFIFVNDESVPIVDRDLGQPQLRLYPNPATDYFRIDGDDDVGKVSVFNIVGRPVRNFDYNREMRMDISGLTSGMYLVRIYDDLGDVLKTVRLNKK